LPGRRITVSTVGFKGRIKKFANDISLPENQKIRKVKLALSLHSTDNGIREAIIPTSKNNRLPDLYEELIYFYRTTGNKVTYEYIHFPGINDTKNDIKRLASLAQMIPSNINIIPFHPIGFNLSKPLDELNNLTLDTNKLLSNQKLNDLIASLREKKVVVNLRTSSGVDINAACGQLALAGENL
jgi:23S rRNA (adenine2503-C2)-methyltransferase